MSGGWVCSVWAGVGCPLQGCSRTRPALGPHTTWRVVRSRPRCYSPLNGPHMMNYRQQMSRISITCSLITPKTHCVWAKAHLQGKPETARINGSLAAILTTQSVQNDSPMHHFERCVHFAGGTLFGSKSRTHRSSREWELYCH